MTIICFISGFFLILEKREEENFIEPKVGSSNVDFSSQAKSENWYKFLEKLKVSSEDFWKRGVKNNKYNSGREELIFLRKKNVVTPNRINKQIKFISLDKIDGKKNFVSKENNHERALPKKIEPSAEKIIALFKALISLKLKKEANLKLGDCHIAKYIIRTEYATVNQDLTHKTITKIHLSVCL